MGKIKYLGLLFLLNNEIVSWIVLAILAWAALIWFVKEVNRETGR